MDTHYDEVIAEDRFNDVLYEASIEASNSMRPHDAIPDFSEKEAEVLAERLTKKESFREAHLILRTWIKRGDRNESNSALFNSLIEITLAFVKKLQMEKEECLKEMENIEKNLLSGNCSICDLKKMGNAIETIEKDDEWDDFTQIERENIQIMKKQFLDLKLLKFMHVFGEKELLDFKNKL